LSTTEVGKLLAACDGLGLIDQRDQALITLALETGMNPISLRAVSIEGTRESTTIVPTQAKGLKAIALPTLAKQMLFSWIAALREAGIRRGPVFIHFSRGPRLHKGISTTAIREMLIHRSTIAKISPKVRPRDLKETWRQLRSR